MSAQNVNAPRKPGRPRGKKSGTANREQLMDIALALFARQGIARTSLNAIAKEAGVTPAMLHYYFNSREALVDNLLEERFMPLRMEIGMIFIAHPDDPVVAFTRLIETLAALAQKHAWFAPLWMQEAIGEEPMLRAHMHSRFGNEKYQQMLETIRRWQQDKKLNPALSPELLFTTLISLVLVPFARARSDTRLSAIPAATIVSHALALAGHGLAG